MSENHLILGGRGFIGRHVAVLLARAGHKVVIADRRPPDFAFPEDVAANISWQSLEFASADWDTLMADVSVVHHYAWTSIPASANQNPSGDLTSNVAATLALLEALRRRGGGRIVFPSSGGTVYGTLKHVPASEDHPLMPITAYGAGKAATEIYLGFYRATHGLDCRVARIANPYGAGQNFLRGQGAATTFLHNALTNKPIVIWGDGEVVRDYIHISDVAAAMVRIASIPQPEKFYTFNVGSGSGVSLNGIIAELERQLNQRLEVKRMASRPFDVPFNVLDISRIRETIGWVPKLTLSEGISRTIIDLEADSPLSRLD